MLKNKWTVLSKKGKNFENLFISFLGNRITDPSLERKDPAELITSHWLQADGNRYFLKDEYQEHKNRLTGYLKKDPKILIASYKNYLKLLGKMEDEATKIPQDNFDKLDIVDYLDKWSFLLKGAMQHGYNYYWFNQDVSDIILAALKNNKSKDVFSDFEILSQAEELSAIQKEKIYLLKIVEDIVQKKEDLESDKSKELINSHLEKYSYLGQYYMRAKPWTNSDVLERIKDILTGDWKKEKQSAESFLTLAKKSEDLLKKYSFNAYEKLLVDLMKKMSHATNRYDEVHAYYFSHSLNLMKYLADRVGANYVELIEMSHVELVDHLQNNKKVNDEFRKILVAREEDSFHLVKNGESTILTDQEARDAFIEEIGGEEIEELKLLTGNCACQGKVRGSVVIFKSIKDLTKVKEGDIMVARATVPAFVPAMERAAGIITEMGGLLSHAAIVSREMHVPCMVGVNNAIKILKTGDKVEVDATNGIIKVL